MSSSDPKAETYDFRTRLSLVRWTVLALLVGLGVRFWVLQVIHHQVYRQKAENNRIRETPIVAPRGAILDRNGNVLVDNTPAFNIVLTPELMENPVSTIETLVGNLDVDQERLLAELGNPRRPRSQPILLKQNATAADRAWVSAHEYEHPEIVVENQPQRRYRYKQLAAHVLGYIGEISSKQLEEPKYAREGYKPGDVIGQGGIEEVYDKILRGRDGIRRMLVDNRGQTVSELERTEPVKGQDIVTTLDIDLQKAAEREFDRRNDTGAAIAMEPATGEILAMVSRPSFDPNVFAEHVIALKNRDGVRRILNDPAMPLFNKAIQGVYPTGSTWKLMIATAAIEEGVITPANSRISCGGGIQVGDRFVHCMGSHGAPDIHTAIVRSCDAYFYRLGLKMGIDMIHEWIVRFGVGQPTGIDLPHEEQGIIPDPAWKKRARPRDPEWNEFDTVMASVGQGSVAIPPLQLLRAESGIMMGGQYHTPHLFKEARETQLSPIKYFADRTDTLKLSELAVDTVSYAAWGVVNEGGTGDAASVPGLDIGGKTGTAQVIAKEKAQGKDRQDQSWFISFAPVHNHKKPEIALVVITEHGGQGKMSAPKARMILAAYFSKKAGHPILPELVARGERKSPLAGARSTGDSRLAAARAPAADSSRVRAGASF